MRLGLDLDNTLVNYESAFARAAWDLGMIDEPWVGTKQALKSHLLKQANGDYTWKLLQGQVYSRYLTHARMVDGVPLFLHRCRLRGTVPWIVSHKTMYGHYDEGGVPLRDAAMEWLEKQGMFCENEYGIDRSQVYFENTRLSKARKVDILGCTHFVDDLPEVFDEPTFPDSVIQIHYCRDFSNEQSPCGKRITSSSWHEIGNLLLGIMDEDEVLRLVNDRWSEVEFTECSSVAGSGNSRVHKLMIDGVGVSSLKSYPDRETENRDRLGIESRTCEFLHEHGVECVPMVMQADRSLNWALYSWVDGEEIREANSKDLNCTLDFTNTLFRLAKEPEAESLSKAWEACLSGFELVRQIHSRIESLLEFTENQTYLENFLKLEFSPVLAQAETRARELWPGSFYREISRDSQTLSPSDFGFHNALRKLNGELVFLDLEYFGWDDPVKLISDFLWHPAMKLSDGLKKTWIDQTFNIFRDDSNLEKRFLAANPLYGLRWALIILNEFLPNVWERRMYASTQVVKDREKTLEEQLKKAKKYCYLVKSLLDKKHEFGFLYSK